MARRRRLALRQVAEPEMRAALSDVEDDAPMAEPNFNLLGMVQAAEADAAPASTQPVIYVDGDHDMDQASTQIVASTTAEQPAKKSRVGTDRTTPSAAIRAPSSSSVPTTTRVSTTPSASRDVFQLYQKGLCDDHTLRLHFIRRRPPQPPSTRIEDDFVLPRPPISVFDLLPPQTTSVSDILSRSSPEEADRVPHPTVPVDELLQTATAHWRQLEATPDDVLLTWRSLQEYDWTQVYKASGLFVPAPRHLIRLLQTLRSDAFALFVWHELLCPTAQSLHRDSSTETLAFAAAMLSHDAFRRLPAKEFRAQLRTKNLRASAPMGVAFELELIDQFHKFRNADV